MTEGEVILQIRIRDAFERPLAHLAIGAISLAAFRHLQSIKPWLGHRPGTALLRVHAQRMSKTLGLAADDL